jgi:hypothetical protein
MNEAKDWEEQDDAEDHCVWRIGLLIGDGTGHCHNVSTIDRFSDDYGMIVPSIQSGDFSSLFVFDMPRTPRHRIRPVSTCN